MKVEIKETSCGKFMEVFLKEGEEFHTQPGSIISYEGNLEIEANIQGGLIGGVLRSFGGESIFITTLKALGDSLVKISPSIPSEIVEINLNGGLIIGDGSYLAHSGDIEVSGKFGGITALSAGSGVIFLHAQGEGKLYLNAPESLIERELSEGEVIYVDNSSFIACEDGMEIEKVLIGKGIIGKLFSGEGVFFKISGPGKLYYSTKSPRGLASAISRYLPKP